MKFLKLEKRNKISYVSFKRTKSLNALNSQTLKELIDLNKELNSDSKTKVVVYRSEGKNFSAGADIKEKQKKLSKLELWKSNLGKEAIESILKINQITIASLRGYCLGGAACIASACDFRIASETTLVAYPEIDLGMNLNWFGLPLLLRLIGPSKTKKMVISGEIENANDLFKWGFIDDLSKDKDLDKKTVALAKKYALKPALPSQMIKRSVNALTYQNDQAIMHMDYDQFLLSREFHKA
ncbi:enoyl-CoA hydratase/isomerase family protein [Gammaproteobacteria bacterium]|nr:enoyl-CoA hydratase/isomerase family protein [Gammaproteobacteria bacterium]